MFLPGPEQRVKRTAKCNHVFNFKVMQEICSHRKRYNDVIRQSFTQIQKDKNIK